MKDRKGFTLIELLTVIVILGIIGVIVTVNVVSVFKKTENQVCADWNDEIEDNACIYVTVKNKANPSYCDRSTGCTVTLGELVDEGYIDKDVDECTKTSINRDALVRVTWDAEGTKKCTYEGR